MWRSLWSSGRHMHLVKFQHNSCFKTQFCLGCHKHNEEGHVAECGVQGLLSGGGAAWLECKEQIQGFQIERTPWAKSPSLKQHQNTSVKSRRGGGRRGGWSGRRRPDAGVQDAVLRACTWQLTGRVWIENWKDEIFLKKDYLVYNVRKGKNLGQKSWKWKDKIVNWLQQSKSEMIRR